MVKAVELKGSVIRVHLALGETRDSGDVWVPYASIEIDKTFSPDEELNMEEPRPEWVGEPVGRWIEELLLVFGAD